MNVGQNINAVFNSPQIAEVALQAVQAGELAERQGLITLRREAARRAEQVTDLGDASEAQGVDDLGVSPGSSPRTPGRRRTSPRAPRESTEPTAEAPRPAPGHLDLLA